MEVEVISYVSLGNDEGVMFSDREGLRRRPKLGRKERLDDTSLSVVDG